METYLINENGILDLGDTPIDGACGIAEAMLKVNFYNEVTEKEIQTRTTVSGNARLVSFNLPNNSTAFVSGTLKSDCCGKDTLVFNKGKEVCSNCLKGI